MQGGYYFGSVLLEPEFLSMWEAICGGKAACLGTRQVVRMEYVEILRERLWRGIWEGILFMRWLPVGSRTFTSEQKLDRVETLASPKPWTV